MKRTLCLFLALILAVGICFSAPVTITASAAEAVTSGNCGASTNEGGESSVTWEYDSATTTLTISGSGAMEDYSYDNNPWESYRNEMTNIIISNGVTSIGSYAFYKCTLLASIEIPQSVTTIGEYAFLGCTALTSVIIPDSVTTIGEFAFDSCKALVTVKLGKGVTTIGSYAFYRCTLLASIEIPQSVTTIGNRAFSGCSALETVIIHDSVTTIGEYAFDSCKALVTVKLGKGVTTIGSYAFYRCTLLASIEIPQSVTTIGNSAFYGCTALETVTISGIETTIGNSAFYGCTSLASVIIPGSVTTIGNSAFSGCSALETVIIPDSVTTIGEYAFKGCTSLASVIIPDSVTTIGNNAFYGCTSLASVIIPDSVTTIGNSAFYGCTSLASVIIPGSVTTSGNNTFFGCSALETVIIRDGVTTIGVCAFYGCTSLASVIIPDSVTTIGNRAFGGCSALETVIIPDSVTTIGENAFDSCKALVTVKLGKGVTTIGSYAFYRCTLLASIEIPQSVTTIGEYAFNGCTSLASVIIPDSVTTIGVHAFYGCTALETVTISGIETTIGTGAFSYCDALSAVNVPCDWDENTYAFGGGVEINYRHTYKNGKCTVANCDNACAHKTITDGVCEDCGGKYCGNTENDKVVWFYDEATTILTISGSGDMANFDSRDMLPPWANYRDSIKKVVIFEGIESIGASAFDSCEKLTSITIPESVTEIGELAFNNCASLTSITVADNNANFSSNEDGILFNKDKSVLICWPAGKEGDCEVPSGVTTIGNNAFSNCVKLQSVTIPVSVTTIGEETFAGCENVNLIVEPGSKAHEFAKTNSIPYIFNGYNEAETAQIEKLTFTEVRNENSEVIGYSVSFCDKEISGALNIPATYNGKPVTEIGSFVFEDCTALSAVTIPKSVTTIGAMAFCRCSSLETITIPKSVTTILAYAFISCDKLTSIIVDENNINYSNSEDGVLFDKNKENLICYPAGKTETSYTVPESVTKIGESAFMHCIALTSVTIPESVTTIAVEAFCGCTALETVTISGIETTIGNDAFYDCPNVTLLVDENSNAHAYALEKNIKYITYVGGSGELGKLTFTLNEDGESYSVTGCDTSISGELKIPATYNGKPVTKIGNGAFWNCKSLTSVVIPDSVVSLGEKAFYVCVSLETVTLSSNITVIPKEAFAYCESLKTLPITENVASIGESAFYGSGKYSKVSLSGVTIGSEAFRFCGITELTLEKCKLNDASAFINNNIEKLAILETDIPDEMFYGNAYIKTLSAENSVLGSKAFSNCTILENVTVSGGEINNGAFADCSLLETVTIDKIGSVGEYAFNNCQALKTVEVNATEISEYAFSMCTSLENVKLSDGVEVIGDAVFETCTSLAELELPETITEIGKGVFNGCDLLTELVIPESVAEISDGAFWGCFNLKYIFFEGTEDAQKTIGDALETNAKIHYGSSTHTFNENYTVDVEPTCTEKGSESQHCKYCGLTQDERPVKELGHTPVNGGTQDAHTKCGVCGEPLSTTHNLTSKITTAPTCTEEGVETFTCECGYTYTKPVAKLGHDIVIDKAVEATCTKTGLTEGSHCSRCDGATVKQDVIPKKGHTEIKGGTEKAHTICSVCKEPLSTEHKLTSKITTEPTCTKEGVETFTCECGYTYTKPVEAKGHDIVTDKAIAPTCTKTGLTEGSHCTRCDGATVAQKEVSALGHTTSVINKKAATCTADGYTGDTYCSVCKTTTAKGTVIKATGHKEVVIPAVAPTFTTVGKTEGKKCSVCGTVTVAQKDVAKLTLSTPTVTQKNTAKGIQVNWNKIDGAESYVVYRSVLSGSNWSKWSAIKKGVTTTSYVDTTVKLGTKYKYTVRAVNGSVMSGYQNTKDGLKYNVTPTVKVALAAKGIKVSWSTAANATGYTVYRSQYNTKTKSWTKWASRGTAKANKTSWTDTKVTSGVQYKYTVRAVNGKVLSSYNKTGAATLYLAQPTVKIANASTGVKVSWSKVTGATGYTVYRSEYKNGAWTKWASRGTAKANKTSWVDTKVASGVQYKYTVRAINGKVASTYVSSNTVLYLAQPKTTVKAVSNGINVAWTQSTGATGYTVYRSEYNAKTKKWSGWKKMGTAKSNKTNWTDKSAKKGVTYKYTTKAINGKTASTYKASSSVKR